MNHVRGRLLLENTDHGIPNVVVAVYDADAGGDATGLRPSANSIPKLDRLGSAVTDADGRFQVSYEDGAFQSTPEKRPDLVLAVTGPESGDQEPAVLHVSPTVRANAGRREEYVVRIARAALSGAGIDVEAIENAPEKEAEQLQRVEARRALLHETQLEIRSAQVAAHRERTEKFAQQVRPDIRARLSNLSETALQDPGYVGPDDSVHTRNVERIVAGLPSFGTPESAGPDLHGLITLTQAQKDALDEARSEDGTVSADALAAVLGAPSAQSETAGSVMLADPIEEICRPRSRHRACGEDALGLPGEEAPADEEGDGGEEPQPVSPVTEEDLLGHAARLLADARSPEEAVAFGLGSARDGEAMREAWAEASEGVRTRVNGLDIEPGPADTTAHFDFHNLRIAFEHVWQEAVDEGVIDAAEDLYHRIVELGGDPDVSDVDSLVREGRIVDHRDRNTRVPSERNREGITATRDLMDDLRGQLQRAHPFTIYAANDKERSVNFGVLVTYRQKWEPLGYQAGEQVETLTLAPGEVRKYSTKRKRHKKRATKEVEKNTASRSFEETDTRRAQSEITAKAYNRTNFTLTAEGSLGDLLDNVSATYTKEARRESEEVKKQFREAVVKAAQEYKEERSLEVSTEETFEEEVTESGEIENANDEVAVTYLFYELQRRFQVSERIHRVTPVVFVAQEVPNPKEIDEGWLVAHDWMLRRVLLDESFRPALTYLSTGLTGDRLAIEQLADNLERQRTLVDELREELVDLRKQTKGRYHAFRQAVAGEAGAIAGEPGPIEQFTDDLIGAGLSAIPVLGAVSGFFSNDPNPEAARVRREAADEAYQQALREEQALSRRLEREVTALQQATDVHNEAVRRYESGRIQIARLKLHVKQNILYYMQAIWSFEPPDQRFFRLHRVPVPLLGGERRYEIAIAPDAEALGFPAHRRLADASGVTRMPYRLKVRAKLDTELETAPLSSVADLDNLMGFKGNYMIFPLFEGNALTDFMAAPYVDKGFDTVVDPDEEGNWTLDEFARYVCCLKQHLPEQELEDLLPTLRSQYDRLLHSPHRNGELITVPTDSLFIEPLPGVKSVVEPFKLAHRAIDVKKVQAEVRAAELDNIRRAARILDKEYEDPDIDKKVVVEGASGDVDIET